MSGRHMNLNLAHIASSASGEDDEDYEDEEEDDGTALGVHVNNGPTIIDAINQNQDQNQDIFTPQPNAFSHPPAQPPSQRLNPRNTSGGDYFTQRHGPSGRENPLRKAANDEALRASLTTLLSCAMAARSLPKREAAAASSPFAPGLTRPGGNAVVMDTVRMVPESELFGEEEGEGRVERARHGVAPPPTSEESPSVGEGRRPRSSTTVSSDHEGSKRKAAVTPRAVRKKRALTHPGSAAGARRAEYAVLSPTLVTWLLSAGVVVVVSVLGFGAGYAMGYEAGKAEAESLSVLGRDVPIPKVKRFRLGFGGAASGVRVGA
jgi:hypothetical protein